MTIRKSTRIWIAVFAGALVVLAIDGPENRLGALAVVAYCAKYLAAAVLLWRALSALFRLIIHRLALRLAFSYFLIGILPIPLLAALFAVFAYLLAHQFMATRMRGAVTDMAVLANASGTALPSVRVSEDARVVASDVPWIRPGDSAAWTREVEQPRALVADGRVWIAIRAGSGAEGAVRLMPIEDATAGWIQKLADRTGYDVIVRAGKGESTGTGYQVKIGEKKRPGGEEGFEFTRPSGSSAEPESFWERAWLTGVYLERAVAVLGQSGAEKPVVAFLARTSPATIVRQLFAQGVPEVTRVVRNVLLGIAFALLFVYLVALAVAFGLVAAIVRNVNRLTRATRAVGAGDFSVRVQSRSRDQIGDLARSFDGMAESIQRLLVETARKEKLEAELATARAVAESLQPETGRSWKGFRVAAHFEPAADLGGDYYDVVPMPDGRTAVSIGDVAGHGLPTALLAADTRASLASLIELGLPASDSFRRLELRTRRSRASNRRLYTTLALFAYDAARGVGTLTNAGHPAPYRISRAGVARLELPALPIGLLTGPDGVYPSRDYPFGPGDRLVLFTDGIVEAADASGDPFGYDRLEALLAENGLEDDRALIERILAAVALHVRERPLDDDRTLVVLTFEDAPAEAPIA